MLPDFTTLKSFFKLDTIKNDNDIFRLHYKATVLFLATFATLTSLKQYVGDPIDCFADGDPKRFPEGALDTYCWIHSTFTLPNNPGSLKNGAMPLPGMGTPKEEDATKYHRYYQWVGFFLIFQAVCFYLPRLTWKMWEGGKLKEMVSGMTSVLMPNEVIEDNKNKLVEYLFANWNQHRIYSYTFFACEVLNFINIIGQIFLLDVFLGGEFTTYGASVIAESEIDPEERTDPMSRIFPKVTKCTFKNYGPSGTIQIIDAMCVLPVNIINEKVFIFLWFWYIILATLTGIAILSRLANIISPKVRFFLLQRQAGKGLMNPTRLNIVFRRCHIGDWFLLMLISQNIPQWLFQDVIEELADRFEGKTI